MIIIMIMVWLLLPLLCYRRHCCSNGGEATSRRLHLYLLFESLLPLVIRAVVIVNRAVGCSSSSSALRGAIDGIGIILFHLSTIANQIFLGEHIVLFPLFFSELFPPFGNRLGHARKQARLLLGANNSTITIIVIIISSSSSSTKTTQL